MKKNFFSISPEHVRLIFSRGGGVFNRLFNNFHCFQSTFPNQLSARGQSGAEAYI